VRCAQSLIDTAAAPIVRARPRAQLRNASGFDTTDVLRRIRAWRFSWRLSWRFLVFGFGVCAHVDYRCAISCKLDTLAISN
jgi:hypothetical protein